MPSEVAIRKHPAADQSTAGAKKSWKSSEAHDSLFIPLSNGRI
jgi:hypothetical protein